jgi:hypothetical protein
MVLSMAFVGKPCRQSLSIKKRSEAASNNKFHSIYTKKNSSAKLLTHRIKRKWTPSQQARIEQAGK